jgi:hypothetical protein
VRGQKGVIEYFVLRDQRTDVVISEDESNGETADAIEFRNPLGGYLRGFPHGHRKRGSYQRHGLLTFLHRFYRLTTRRVR